MKLINSIKWIVLTIIFAGFHSTSFAQKTNDANYLTYIVNPKNQDIQLYWKDDKGEILKTISRLKNFVASKNKRLVFAMNAGMYTTSYGPLGLFIQHNKTLKAINRANAKGNFYMKPNGIFYITNDNKAVVCKTEDFVNNVNIKFATQSGPMLLFNGKMHPSFSKSGTSLYIRNGVGILPNNQVVFVMSKVPVNFYEFAAYFKSLGCKDALYLDGAISETYWPAKNYTQTYGSFGVLIGVTQ